MSNPALPQDTVQPPPAPECSAPGAASAVGDVPGDFVALDRRVIKLWRLRHLASTAMLLALLAVVGSVFWANFTPLRPWLGGFWLVVALIRLGLFWWYPSAAYRAWGYRLDGRVLEIRHGVWFRTLQLLPLARLQHVDLHSGPIERALGLGSLLLHTAGTHQATLVIPGLEAAAAARLRDHLAAVGGDDGV